MSVEVCSREELSFVKDNGYGGLLKREVVFGGRLLFKYGAMNAGWCFGKDRDTHGVGVWEAIRRG